jgi:hypothetical protein
MFTLAVRYSPAGAWYSNSVPLTLQTAVGNAQALAAHKHVADQVRLVPTSPAASRLLDIRI